MACGLVMQPKLLPANGLRRHVPSVGDQLANLPPIGTWAGSRPSTMWTEERRGEFAPGKGARSALPIDGDQSQTVETAGNR